MAESDLLLRSGLVPTPSALIESHVAVANGQISAIARGPPLAAARVIDASEGVVLLGFLNAHMHESMERGVFEDLPFDRSLHECAFHHLSSLEWVEAKQNPCLVGPTWWISPCKKRTFASNRPVVPMLTI